MINKEKEKPEILKKLKCLACNSKIVYSMVYKYKQLPERKLLTKFRNKEALRFSLDVPICLNCNKRFHRWMIYTNLSISIFLIGNLSIILGIFCLIFHHIFEDLGIKIIGVGFLLNLSSLISRYVLRRIKSNPNNYFFYDFISKVFYVKPSKENNWIPYSIWIKSITGK